MSNAHPLISVIVPVYNTAPYLRKCLDSVCNQTYRELEIICVDDGSTDNSAEILAEYAAQDSRIIIISQENAGQAAARNAALDVATGTWITGVDSDDYLEPDAYEYCIKHLSPNDDDVKLIVYSFNAVDGHTHKQLYRYKQPADGLVTPTPDILYKTDCYFWNKLWHREIFRQADIRFPEGMWFEDVALFYLTAPYLPKILYLPREKAHYVRYSDYASSMDKARALPHKNLERIRAVEIALEYYEKHPLPQSMATLPPGLILLFYRQLREYLTPETEQTAWEYLRRIIDTHQLLPSLNSSPELALCYYMPPCALNALSRHFASMREFELLLIAKRLKRRYLLLSLLIPFSFISKKQKLQYEKKHIKAQLHWLRYRTRQTWKEFKMNEVLN